MTGCDIWNGTKHTHVGIINEMMVARQQLIVGSISTPNFEGC